jgi:hypothetical protein
MVTLAADADAAVATPDLNVVACAVPKVLTL